MNDTDQILMGGEIVPDVEIIKLADGLGFGDPDGISHKNRDDVLPENLDKAVAFIDSPQVLVPVDKDKNGKMLEDDGCGDGRGWKKIIVKVGDEIREKTKSLNRAKQFGGGMMMAAAGLITTGRALGDSLRDTVSRSISLLEERRLGFGAHTDDHAHGPNCGCGAIDKAPQILENSVKYEQNIRSVAINVLGIEESFIDKAYENIKSFLPSMDSESYQGSSVAEAIIEEGKVVKELEGEHLEMFILLNEVEGFTVDQNAIREISDEQIQVFSVDVWRMRQQANDSYDNDYDRDLAFAGSVIYTLATAGTLTAGDLPVYLIKNSN